METKPAVVFDVKAAITLKLVSAEGERKIRVRFPTDAEWTDRARKRKVVIKQLGRGISETQIGHAEEVDAALLTAIREENDNTEVDAFEASQLIEQLGKAEVDDVELVPGGFRVITRVPGGLTVHVLKMPTAKDSFQYRRSFARVFDLPYNKQELTINLQAAADLYARLVQSTEGYGDAVVPIIHQAIAVKAAVDGLEHAVQGDRDANF
jgi:hypothetical protein